MEINRSSTRLKSFHFYKLLQNKSFHRYSAFLYKYKTADNTFICTYLKGWNLYTNLQQTNSLPPFGVEADRKVKFSVSFLFSLSHFFLFFLSLCGSF